MKPKYAIGPALITWLILGGFSILVTAPLSVGYAALGLLGVTLYFLPALTAEERRHRQRFPIYLLNLLLGWTLVGWIVSLVWTYTTDVEKNDDTPTENA